MLLVGGKAAADPSGQHQLLRGQVPVVGVNHVRTAIFQSAQTKGEARLPVATINRANVVSTPNNHGHHCSFASAGYLNAELVDIGLGDGKAYAGVPIVRLKQCRAGLTLPGFDLVTYDVLGFDNFKSLPGQIDGGCEVDVYGRRTANIFQKNSHENAGTLFVIDERAYLKIDDFDPSALGLHQASLSDIGRSLRGFGGGFRIVSAARDQLQLPDEQRRLNANSDEQQQRKESRGVVREPAPDGAIWLMLGGLLLGLMIGWGLGWWVTRR